MNALDRRYETFEKGLKHTRFNYIKHPEIYADAFALGLDLNKLDRLIDNPYALGEIYIMFIRRYRYFKSVVEKWTGDDIKETLEQLEALREKYQTRFSNLLHSQLKHYCFED